MHTYGCMLHGFASCVYARCLYILRRLLKKRKGFRCALSYSQAKKILGAQSLSEGNMHVCEFIAVQCADMFSAQAIRCLIPPLTPAVYPISEKESCCSLLLSSLSLLNLCCKIGILETKRMLPSIVHCSELC